MAGLCEEDGVGGNREVRWRAGVELKVGCEGGAAFDDLGAQRAEPNDSADAADGLDQRSVAAGGAREFSGKALDVSIFEVGAGSKWSFQMCSQILFAQIGTAGGARFDAAGKINDF